MQATVGSIVRVIQPYGFQLPELGIVRTISNEACKRYGVVGVRFFGEHRGHNLHGILRKETGLYCEVAGVPCTWQNDAPIVEVIGQHITGRLWLNLVTQRTELLPED